MATVPRAAAIVRPSAEVETPRRISRSPFPPHAGGRGPIIALTRVLQVLRGAQKVLTVLRGAYGCFTGASGAAWCSLSLEPASRSHLSPPTSISVSMRPINMGACYDLGMKTTVELPEALF